MTRIARIGFGLVLVSGALFLAQNAVRLERAGGSGGGLMHCRRIILLAWIAALFVGFIGSLVRDRGDRHRVAGYVVPAVGMALMLPITLHLFVASVVGYSERSFDDWCFWSVVFVSVAHIVFAILVGVRAAAIVGGRPPISVGTIYIAAVTLAGVPGVVLVIPLVITAVTGLPLVPLLYGMERWGERATVPTAILKAAA
jgi:hypothetical protein